MSVVGSRAKRHVIRSQKQLAVLASAPRLEIVDILADAGTLSVAELAAVLERPADALYFHLRALLRAGLVRRTGFRYRGRRKRRSFGLSLPTCGSNTNLGARPIAALSPPSLAPCCVWASGIFGARSSAAM